MMQGWPARYHDGRTAKSQEVAAQLGADGLIVTDAADAQVVSWPFGEIRLIDGPNDDGTIKLGRVDAPGRLTLRQADTLDALEMHCSGLHRSMDGHQPWRAILLWSGIAIAAIAFLIVIAIPFAARHAAQWLSPAREVQLGDQVADAIIFITVTSEHRQHPDCSTVQGDAALKHLTSPLMAQLALPEPPRIRIVNSAMLNALSLPGGQILVFKGLLDFVESPSELAGILAHEGAHIELGHPTALVIQRSATAFLIGLLLGDVFGGSAVGAAGAAILDAHFGQDAERAADARALILLQKAGIDPHPFAAFFERLDAKGQQSAIPLDFLSSHPLNAERAQHIEAAPHQGGQALDPQGWQALKPGYSNIQ